MMRNAIPNPRPARATRYEITATHPALPPVVIGFTARKSRYGLLGIMQARGDELIALCNVGAEDGIVFSCRPKIHARVNGWTIGFSGRTERDAQQDPVPEPAVQEWAQSPLARLGGYQQELRYEA